MKKTIVYILLLLVAASLTLPITPHASCATEDAKILNYTYYFDATGILVAVGEVQNIGQDIINTVIISGIATTSSGVEVLSGDLAWGNNLLPVQKAPFYMQFRSNLTSNGAWVGGLSGFNIRVIQAPTTTEHQYQGITITKHQFSQSSGEYSVSGEVKNTGAETASNVAVVATFYNSEGKPVAVGYSSRVTTMAPEGINSFTLSAINFNQTTTGVNNKIDNYELIVQVEDPLLSGTPPPAPTPITGPVDSQTPTNTGNNLSPIFIVVFVVAIVAVIITWLLIKRHRSTQLSPRGSINSNRRSRNKKRRRR